MKTDNLSILILPGDGIGQEVTPIVIELLQTIKQRNSNYQNLTWQVEPIGGACYDRYGAPITDEILTKAKSARAILFGAVGAPQYDKVAREKRPEVALLTLRKELDLFANIRPAKVFTPLVAASSLKPHLVENLDIVILRELTAGVYFGKPRGLEKTNDGATRCVDTQSYNEQEILRIGEIGFAMAAMRKKTLHSVDKANVMETGAFWRNIISNLATKYPSVTLHHMYADNCAMQLIKNPKQFDVIVTDNLFGDILSDAAAMATGSLGMLPSASLGPTNAMGQRPAMYEPIHGSAPDIAGKDIANPLAMILSTAMMFRYSFQDETTASNLEQAVTQVLDLGFRTNDIMGEEQSASNYQLVGTKAMAAAVLKEFSHL